MQAIKTWFSNLTPNGKRTAVLGGLSGAILLVITLAVTLTSEEKKPSAPRNQKKVDYSILTGKDTKIIGIEALNAQVKRLTTELEGLKKIQEAQAQAASRGEKPRAFNSRLPTSLQTGGEETVVMPGLPPQSDNAPAEESPVPVSSLRSAKERIKARETAARSARDPSVPLPPTLSVRQQPQPEVAPITQPPANAGDATALPSTPPATPAAGEEFKIHIFEPSGEANASGKSAPGPTGPSDSSSPNGGLQRANFSSSPSATDPIHYLTAGSILSGTLITGMDAPTSKQAKQDPFPALLRVKHNAILPNRFSMDVRECFLIAAGHGDLSSERAYLRAESISCVRNDGGIIESTLDAYASGEDGKAGVRGRLVSKQGQLIGRALLSGFVSGLADAFRPQRVNTLNVNPGNRTQFEAPDVGDAMEQAGYKGISNGANEIAKYYLEMAKNIFPVIEIDAGRKVDFILTKGVPLRAKPMNGASPTRLQAQSSPAPVAGQLSQEAGQIIGSTLRGVASGVGKGALTPITQRRSGS